MAYPSRRQLAHALRARRRDRAITWWLDAAGAMARAVESNNLDLLPERAPAYAIAPDGVDAALMIIVQLARQHGLTADALGAWLTEYRETTTQREAESD